MPEQQIKRTLAELHEELANVDDLDPALKSLLEEVDADIHSLLNAQSREEAQTGVLTERLESLGASFAARYPTTERFFQEIIATLGRLGV